MAPLSRSRASALATDDVCWPTAQYTHTTPVSRWFRIVSIAIVVLPVCRSPTISSRWPRPIGTSASIALMPVCNGSSTGPRSMMAGGRRSMRRRSVVWIGPASSSGRPAASTTRPSRASPTPTSMTRPVRRTEVPAVIPVPSSSNTTPTASRSSSRARPRMPPSKVTNSSKPTPTRPLIRTTPSPLRSTTPRSVACGRYVNPSRASMTWADDFWTTSPNDPTPRPSASVDMDLLVCAAPGVVRVSTVTGLVGHVVVGAVAVRAVAVGAVAVRAVVEFAEKVADDVVELVEVVVRTPLERRSRRRHLLTEQQGGVGRERQVVASRKPRRFETITDQHSRRVVVERRVHREFRAVTRLDQFVEITVAVEPIECQLERTVLQIGVGNVSQNPPAHGERRLRRAGSQLSLEVVSLASERRLPAAALLVDVVPSRLEQFVTSVVRGRPGILEEFAPTTFQLIDLLPMFVFRRIGLLFTFLGIVEA